MQKTMGTSAVESLNAAGNIFIGQVLEVKATLTYNFPALLNIFQGFKNDKKKLQFKGENYNSAKLDFFKIWPSKALKSLF